MIKDRISTLGVSAFLFCFLCPGNIYSQWTKEDSLWLKDVFAGEKELHLNPEVMEAIRLGDLLNIDKQNTGLQLKHMPSRYPLAKDFSSYIQVPDSGSSKVDHTKIPPSVFLLYDRQSSKFVELKSFSLNGLENYDVKPSTPLVITDPLTRGQASGGVVFLISINKVVDFFLRKK